MAGKEYKEPRYDNIGLDSSPVGWDVYDDNGTWLRYEPNPNYNGGGAGTGYSPGVSVVVPNAPEAKKSAGRIEAKNTYLDWVKWKRQELQNLITKYKTEFPKQINAYEAKALGALPESKKNMWGEMYTNLNQRGLSDSSSFIGGARKDLESWESAQKADIISTKQGMEAQAQQAILSALGQPNYADLYKNWVVADDQQNAYDFRQWQKEQ